MRNCNVSFLESPGALQVAMLLVLGLGSKETERSWSPSGSARLLSGCSYPSTVNRLKTFLAFLLKHQLQLDLFWLEYLCCSFLQFRVQSHSIITCLLLLSIHGTHTPAHRFNASFLNQQSQKGIYACEGTIIFQGKNYIKYSMCDKYRSLIVIY